MLQLTDDVEINRNSYRSNDVSARSEMGFEETVEEYLKSHDVTFKLPLVDSKITLGARSLDNDELDVKVKFSDENVQGTFPLYSSTTVYMLFYFSSA